MTAPPSIGPTRARRILYSAVLVLLVLSSCELMARAYLRLVAGGELLHPDRVIYGFYPELRRVQRELEAERKGAYEILLLGGSALHPQWGAIEALIAERLSGEQRRPVRIHNLAVAGHTTRDSRLKYERLGDAPVDLVIVYHGINETRTNNAPREVFRDDYGHYAWYSFANAAVRDRWLPWLALPYAAKRASLSLRERLGLLSFIPESEPRPEWLEYGTEVKSAKPFRDNLTAILDRAAARGEPVLLMTFASHIATGYSEEAFTALALDYTRHRSPLWWWGTPESVRVGLETHNGIIRDLATTRGTLFVDQAALIPGERKYWNDVCHMTVAGSELFVDNMVPALRQASTQPPPG